MKVKTLHLMIITIIGTLLAGGYFYLRETDAQTPLGEIQLEECFGSLTILYDNYLFADELVAEWGFSCLIEIEDQVILFDTGGDPEILTHNINELEIDVSEIDCIVLSHEHWDHIGGLEAVLDENPGIPVYIPEMFPYHIKSTIRSLGGEVVETVNSTKICESVATTLVLRGPPFEHSLMICTEDGLILVTGCSHPGVDKLVMNAHELTGRDICLVIGGFHLGGASLSVLDDIVDVFDMVGVRRVAATHCTGDVSIDFFRDYYGDEFIEVGAGFNMDF